MDKRKSAICHLHYQSIMVGVIEDAFESDATWYGIFRSCLNTGNDSVQARLQRFIEFSIDWNERTRNSSMPPHVSEWEKYHDIVYSGFWRITVPSGDVKQIKECPVFFIDDEITWAIF